MNIQPSSPRDLFRTHVLFPLNAQLLIPDGSIEPLYRLWLQRRAETSVLEEAVATFLPLRETITAIVFTRLPGCNKVGEAALRAFLTGRPFECYAALARRTQKFLRKGVAPSPLAGNVLMMELCRRLALRLDAASVNAETMAFEPPDVEAALEAVLEDFRPVVYALRGLPQSVRRDHATQEIAHAFAVGTSIPDVMDNIRRRPPTRRPPVRGGAQPVLLAPEPEVIYWKNQSRALTAPGEEK